MKDLSFKETLRLFKNAFEKSRDKDLKSMSRTELMKVICAGCPFYAEEKEPLECGAFRIIAAMIEKDLIDESTFEDLFKDFDEE